MTIMDIKLISRVWDVIGFTLLELIAVMAMISLLASLAVPLFIDLDASAGQKALGTAVSELNSRERMVKAIIGFGSIARSGEIPFHQLGIKFHKL